MIDGDRPAVNSEGRKVANQHARTIAELTESKFVSYNRNHLNEPTWYYRVPIHKHHFWFSILVSDGHFMLKGCHNRYRAFADSFAFSFKYPWTNLATTTFLPKVSDELNIHTFSSEISYDSEFSGSAILRTIAESLREIDIDLVHLFFLNSTQIYFVSEFKDAAACVETCASLQALALSCFETLHATEGP
jgi:hypothetical protein